MVNPESDFEEFDTNDLWAQVYQRIRSEASLNHDFSLKDSRKPDFRSRNRYRDVSPYDHSRIRLDRDEVDYINASLVLCPESNRKYILTQGPLSTTSGHFWLMVYEQNCKAILMLNRIIEKGMVKCHQYFPEGSDNDGDDELEFEDVGIKVRFLNEQDCSYFVVRTLELTDLRSGDKKEVLQFHYTTWPDFGVPESPAAFLHFLWAVRRSGALDSNIGPPVIHCSAGIGRSGTFCLVDTCLILIEKNRSIDDIDVRDVLMEMRTYRMGLIQTPDQLRFSYLAIIEGAKRVLSASADSGFESDIPPLSPGAKLTPSDEEISASPPSSATTPFSMTPPSAADPDDISDIPNEPPPLPPRRSSPQSQTEDKSTHLLKDSSKSNGSATDMHKEGGSEIRRRKREERLRNTAEQVERMKAKQKDHELWKERQTSLRPLLIGLGISLLVGGAAICLKYYWS